MPGQKSGSPIRAGSALTPGAVSPGRVGQFQRLSAPAGAFASAVGNFMSPSTLQQLRAVWEAVNNRWNQWVINYTQSRQLNLLQSLGFESPSWTDLLRLLGVSLSALALLWLVWARVTPTARRLESAHAQCPTIFAAHRH